jgi:hypothetical protein
MNNAEEASKISRETKFAVLGRAIADAFRAEGNTSALISEAMRLRHIEQDQADKQTQFAGLARQIGDAARNGKDTQALLERIAELRRHELG